MSGNKVAQVLLLGVMFLLVASMYTITDFITFRPGENDIVLSAGEGYQGFTFNGIARNYASPDQAIITYGNQTYYYQMGDTFKTGNTMYKIKDIALGKNSVIVSVINLRTEEN